MRVLVVEDNPELAYMLTSMLRAEGWDVDACTEDFDSLLNPDTWEGLDAALFDLWLARPDLDGEPDALPYLRYARELCPQCRLVIFSADDPGRYSWDHIIEGLGITVLIKGRAHLNDIVQALRG